MQDYEVERFAQQAKRYVETLDFSDKANAELKLYNFALRVNRAELLRATLIMTVGESIRKELNETDKFIIAEGLKEYQRQAGIMGMTVPTPMAMEARLKALSNTSFKGAEWSEVIWGKKRDRLERLAYKVSEDLIIHGRHPTEIIPEVRRAFRVSAYEAKRLAVTESTRVQMLVQKEVLTSNDVDYFIWVPEPTACADCMRMAEESYRVRDLTPGINAPPLHPNCRCTVAPDDSKSREELEKFLEENF